MPEHSKNKSLQPVEIMPGGVLSNTSTVPKLLGVIQCRPAARFLCTAQVCDGHRARSMSSAHVIAPCGPPCSASGRGAVAQRVRARNLRCRADSRRALPKQRQRSRAADVCRCVSKGCPAPMLSFEGMHMLISLQQAGTRHLLARACKNTLVGLERRGQASSGRVRSFAHIVSVPCVPTESAVAKPYRIKFDGQDDGFLALLLPAEPPPPRNSEAGPSSADPRCTRMSCVHASCSVDFPCCMCPAPVSLVGYAAAVPMTLGWGIERRTAD